MKNELNEIKRKLVSYDSSEMSGRSRRTDISDVFNDCCLELSIDDDRRLTKARAAAAVGNSRLGVI